MEAHVCWCCNFAVADDFNVWFVSFLSVCNSGVEPSGRAFNTMCLDERFHDADVQLHKHLLRQSLDEHNSPDVRQACLDEATSMKIRPAIPHNPCINAGAIMCASLVLPEASEDERFDHVMGVWRDLCG